MNFDPLGDRSGQPLSVNAMLTATVADLEANYSSAVQSGAQAWASDGRKTGEGAGAGTGVPVYADNQDGTVTWRVYADDTAVAD